MKIIRDHKMYFIAFAIFCSCLFTAPHVYSHWHFDAINPVELYQMDKFQWERENPNLTEIGYMNYNEWQQMQDHRHQDWLNYVGDQCASCLDPWYESDSAKKENN